MESDRERRTVCVCEGRNIVIQKTPKANRNICYMENIGIFTELVTYELILRLYTIHRTVCCTLE